MGWDRHHTITGVFYFSKGNAKKGNGMTFGSLIIVFLCLVRLASLTFLFCKTTTYFLYSFCSHMMKPLRFGKTGFCFLVTTHAHTHRLDKMSFGSESANTHAYIYNYIYIFNMTYQALITEMVHKTVVIHVHSCQSII